MQKEITLNANEIREIFKFVKKKEKEGHSKFQIRNDSGNGIGVAVSVVCLDDGSEKNCTDYSVW